MKLSALVAEAQESLKNDGDREVVAFSQDDRFTVLGATKKGQTFQIILAHAPRGGVRR